jgi:FkbM family methyltransferase
MMRASVIAPVKSLARRTLERAGWLLEKTPGHLSLASHVIKLIGAYDIDCVLDIGANRGQYGSLLRAAGYRGRIVSFEPVPEAFAELESAARGDAAWETHQLALADRSGTMPLNVAASSSVSSFLTPTIDYVAGYAGGRVERTEDVRVERLDILAPDLGFRCALLKSDTQGYDLHVIEGAVGCLKDVAAVQIEMSAMPIYEGMPNLTDALASMRERGFTPSGIFPVSMDEKLRAYEFDGVFVRA